MFKLEKNAIFLFFNEALKDQVLWMIDAVEKDEWVIYAHSPILLWILVSQRRYSRSLIFIRGDEFFVFLLAVYEADLELFPIDLYCGHVDEICMWQHIYFFLT